MMIDDTSQKDKPEPDDKQTAEPRKAAPPQRGRTFGGRGAEKRG